MIENVGNFLMSDSAQLKPENKYLEQLKKIVLDYARDLPMKIYLIGSRAHGNARRTSDVDIAILPLGTIPEFFFSNLSEIIEESTVPYFVDLVDLSQLDELSRKKFLRGAISWKD